jgi:2-aminoethylphosphonate-pyruvate transaminase
MHDYFYSKGFTLYPGKLDQLNTFRVANIGDISCKDIKSFLAVLEQYLKDIGFI